MPQYFSPKTNEISQMEKKHMESVRMFAAECMVLLENDGTLPLKGLKGNIALYGNGARQTIKGGTGSGDVYSRNIINIEQGLEDAGFTITTKSWIDQYEQLHSQAKAEYREKLTTLAKENSTHPILLMFDHPFEEPPLLPLSKEDILKSDTDTAIFVLSRNSGEGMDRYNKEGDYLLSEEEIDFLTLLGKSYDKLIVLLNLGNVIDTYALKNIPGINAILFVGQAGNCTGLSVADAICGRSIPSGKLIDTWALHYEDYPSSGTFSHNNDNLDDEYYTEGIYVGYRYFDTFNVTPSYCFGYGLSYTNFSIQTLDVEANEEDVVITVQVDNTGTTYGGKEVVQVYYTAPDSDIEKPYQELAAFAKTKHLLPGESQTLVIRFKTNSMASYNPRKAAWILDAGKYYIRVGNSSRNTKIVSALVFEQDAITAQLKNLFPTVHEFKEISKKGVGPYSYDLEGEEKLSAKLIHMDPSKIKSCIVNYQETKQVYSIPKTDKRITMDDVFANTHSLEDLIAQLTVEEMAEICVGTARQGFSRSTIGVASAAVPGAAGDTTSLLIDDRNVRNLVMADGPAGLRLQPHFVTTKDGELLPIGMTFGDYKIENKIDVPEDAIHYYQYCTAIPTAYLLASSWDLDLIDKAGSIVGAEMKKFGVTLWLAPGMNIHRNPLCGRNFEYYSEDPLVTGVCAVAMTQGVQSYPGIGTTIKHYAANNQEDNRFYTNAHISERTLREIYLKGFEIAVKSAQPMAIMSSYNLLNGIHTANNYDLLTTTLRDEWGFGGFVMTDWNATQDNSFGKTPKDHKYSYSSSVLCIHTGNDLQMPGCQENIDDIVAAVKAENGSSSEKLTLAELQECTRNILRIVAYSSRYEDAKPYTQHFTELPWLFRVENPNF